VARDTSIAGLSEREHTVTVYATDAAGIPGNEMELISPIWLWHVAALATGLRMTTQVNIAALRQGDQLKKS